MKKATALIIIFSLLTSICSFAADTRVEVIIPDYQVIIDNSSVYYNDSLYPFINYKGITYLPMTYEYCRAMNLTTGWLKGSAFMVAYNPCDDKLPVYKTIYNAKTQKAIIPTGYRIYVNGKKIDNKSQNYPLLNFRDVTYFPMTWDFATNEFGWEISFENDIFNITTENNTGKTWYLTEKGAENAVFKRGYNKPQLQPDGSYKYGHVEEFFSVDYSSGALTELTGYIEKEKEQPVKSNIPVDLSVKDGYVYYKEQKLDGIYIEMASDSYVKPEGVETSKYTVTAHINTSYEPLKVCEVQVTTVNFGEINMQSYKGNYTFICNNDNFIPLGLWKTVESVYTLGEDIYFNTVDYAQTIFRHYKQNRALWKLSADGTLTEVKYGDYNSIKIIGKANDKLYLKCLWAPENYIDDFPYSVSLINDGYHTFDGNGIKFLSPYIYSDFDIVSDNGDIIAVNNKLGKITKAEINPEYY